MAIAQHDLEHPANCACFNLRRAARKITQVYDQALRPVGLPATQFALLATLAETAGEDGVAMTALARSLGMDRTTLTRNLAVAERDGWVQIIAGEDRRERLVGLTQQGRNRFEAALPYWKTAQESLRDRLDNDGFADLLKLTRQLGAD
jgi:DNA-binding MarR family transcriptional regulator